MAVSRSNATHYNWGDGCDGWVLLPRGDMTAIEERMPPNTCEQRHYHEKARQFFYVLVGQLTMELDGERHFLTAGDSIEIPPGTSHQAMNDTLDDVRFLVVSSPTTHGDRVTQE